MIEQRVMVANILDDCARLLELAEGEADHAYYIGYVGGFLARAAEALRAGDTASLGHQATALDGEVARVQMQAALAERDQGEDGAG